MGLFRSASIKRRLYMSFACMWAIMIFFAFFRGQQLGTVMSRYNMAMETLNIQQQYIGNIVTSLNMLHFNDLIFGAFGDFPELHQRISPMLLDRDAHIEGLYHALENYRYAILADGILTMEEAAIHFAILDEIMHRLYAYFIPAGQGMIAALETGSEEAFAEALFVNFNHGHYLTLLAWQLRDRTFAFVDYVKETMLYYDQIEDRIFNIATVIGISTAIFLAVILARTIQKPIAELKAAMTEVASGNLNHPIRMARNDDIGRLSHDIADMVASVTAIKDRFLAKMSHEIRTPLTAVIGISEIELRKDSHEKDITESFAKIHNSSKALLGIVNDLLDISKIKDKNIPNQRFSESLHQLCNFAHFHDRPKNESKR